MFGIFSKKSKKKNFKPFNDKYMRIYNAHMRNMAIEQEMTSKHCPINGALCNTECVHFRKGTIEATIVDYDEFSVIHSTEKPTKCKLWGTQF